MKKILVTGKNGQIGWELQRTLSVLGHVVAIDSDEVDFLSPDSLRNIIRLIKPDVIVNAAAYTAVDKAETEKEIAMAVNGVAPGILAEEAKKLGAILIHYSTDYVFNGKSSKPYLENDAPQPLNFYGHTKLVGEQAIQAVGGSYLILRTSWVYGCRGNNFLLTMLRLALTKPQLRVVNDQIGSPTWSRLVAQSTAQIIARSIAMPGNHWGIYNLTSAGQVSWQGFAQAIFKQRNQSVEVVGIPTSEYPTPAKRPAYSVLENHKLQSTFGIVMPTWDAALALCMQDMK